MNMAGHKAEYRGSLAVNSVNLLDMSIMTAGDSRAEGISAVGDNPPFYRKIALHDGVICGLIAVNQVDNMGIITAMIRKRVLFGPWQRCRGTRPSGYRTGRCSFGWSTRPDRRHRARRDGLVGRLPLYSMADQLSWAQSERALCLGILQGFFQGYFSKDIFRGMYWKWKIRAYRYSFQFQ